MLLCQTQFRTRIQANFGAHSVHFSFSAASLALFSRRPVYLAVVRAILSYERACLSWSVLEIESKVTVGLVTVRGKVIPGVAAAEPAFFTCSAVASFTRPFLGWPSLLGKSTNLFL